MERKINTELIEENVNEVSNTNEADTIKGKFVIMDFGYQKNKI
jgi:hypothetical protein